MLDFYTLYFDGACGPKNPGGTAAYGYALYYQDKTIERQHSIIGSGPEMSNNVAEYAGLSAGLKTFAEYDIRRPMVTTLQVRGDSKLVINQMSGEWKARSGLYIPYYEQAQAWCRALRKRGLKISFDWIPRELNQECDTLSKTHISI